MLAAAASIASSSRPGDGYRYTLTVATVLQPHDGLHLAEWLEYHSLPEIGVEHFYLYDSALRTLRGNRHAHPPHPSPPQILLPATRRRWARWWRRTSPPGW